jgi:hypothetical protein
MSMLRAKVGNKFHIKIQARISRWILRVHIDNKMADLGGGKYVACPICGARMKS